MTIPIESGSSREHGEAGFTLLEALIALAIVAMVVTTCLSIRTGALIDATEARNWRVAREVAQQVLSELQAGARTDPPDYRMPEPLPIPQLKDVDKKWNYLIVVGEERISSTEGDIEASAEDSSGNSSSRRREWQQERDDLRKARQKGMNFYDYREQTQNDEFDRDHEEDSPPSEDETEQVAVFVFFPNVRNPEDRSYFMLKATLSTLAIQGLTPEEAETANEASNQGATSGSEGSGSESR